MRCNVQSHTRTPQLEVNVIPVRQRSLHHRRRCLRK